MWNRTTIVAQGISVRGQIIKNIKSKQIFLEQTEREGTVACCEIFSLPGRQIESF